MIKSFDKVYIIQSYPNLTFLTNKLFEEKSKVAVIVSLDRSIYKFLKRLNIKNVTIFLVGNAIVYRKSLFWPIRKLYTQYIWYRIPVLTTNTLIITYANWVDVGALYLKKISFEVLEQYIAYAEKRYDISSDQNINFSSFQKFIQTKTNGLIENKKYNSFVKKKKVVMSGVGLVNLKNIWPNIKTYNVKNSNQINELAINSYILDKPFFLFMDKDLVKSKQISWLKLIILYYNIKLIFKKKKIKIAFKFKPRHFSFFKYLILKIIGYKILPTEPPSQLFASQKKCIGIIGFTSSSMSTDYEKKLISLSTLKNTFNKSLIGNIESMKQRNESKSDKIIFIEYLSQLANII
jgi:hypothetical protein